MVVFFTEMEPTLLVIACNDFYDYHTRDTLVLNTGDMAPRVIFHNDPSTPPVPTWHDQNENPESPNNYRNGHHSMTCSNKGLEHDRETTPIISAINSYFPGQIIGVTL